MLEQQLQLEALRAAQAMRHTCTASAWNAAICAARMLRPCWRIRERSAAEAAATPAPCC